MKSKKKTLGDVCIRLKPKESNILENYMKHRKRTRKKKKKKSKKKKQSFKSIEIKEKKDPFLQIVEDSNNKVEKEGLVVTEIKEKPEDKHEKTRTIHVDSKPRDLSETDPNVKKTVIITASLKPEKKKEGTGVIL
jgi:hypothetical protein